MNTQEQRKKNTIVFLTILFSIIAIAIPLNTRQSHSEKVLPVNQSGSSVSQTEKHGAEDSSNLPDPFSISGKEDAFHLPSPAGTIASFAQESTTESTNNNSEKRAKSKSNKKSNRKQNNNNKKADKDNPSTTVPSSQEKKRFTYENREQYLTDLKQSYADKINFNAYHPFLIKVNRIANRVTVYGLDYNGIYSIPYLAFTCSVGNPYTKTPTGTFSISDKYDWRLMVDQTYAQYAVRISGQIMFHSVGYYSASKADLEYEEYNKLGFEASLGCIRLTCIDAKWIYDNCPVGTSVIIYDDPENPGPIDAPEVPKIDLSSPYRNWDPTDPDPSNPWKYQQETATPRKE